MTNHSIDAYFMLFPFQSEVPHPVRLELFTEVPQGRLADENPARMDVGVGREEVLVELLEPRRGVDGVADHDVFGALGAAESAGDHRAGEDPDAHSGRRPMLGAPSAVQLAEGGLHGQGTVHGVDGILSDLALSVPDDWHAEDGDDRIAGILPDDASVRAD